MFQFVGIFAELIIEQCAIQHQLHLVRLFYHRDIRIGVRTLVRHKLTLSRLLLDDGHVPAVLI